MGASRSPGRAKWPFPKCANDDRNHSRGQPGQNEAVGGRSAGSKIVRQPSPYQPSASGPGVAACQKPAADRAVAAAQMRSRGLRNQPHAASTSAAEET